jgi:hypothetical protein
MPRMNAAPWIFATLLAAPAAHAAECTPAPVKSSQQAVCYATAYAEKNRLPHKGAGVTRKVSKGAKTWTVVYGTKKDDGSRGPGWQVEVDIASGTPTRFSSFK